MPGCASAVPIVASWPVATVTAPAAEALKKPREIGDNDWVDIVLLAGPAFVAQFTMLSPAP